MTHDVNTIYSFGAQVMEARARGHLSHPLLQVTPLESAYTYTYWFHRTYHQNGWMGGRRGVYR